MYEHCLNMQSVKSTIQFKCMRFKQNIVFDDKYINRITVYLKYLVY